MCRRAGTARVNHPEVDNRLWKLAEPVKRDQMDTSIVFLVLLLIVIALIYYVCRKTIAIERFLRRTCGVRWDGNWGSAESIKIWYLDRNDQLQWYSLSEMNFRLKSDRRRDYHLAPSSWIAEVECRKVGRKSKEYFLHSTGWKPWITIKDTEEIRELSGLILDEFDCLSINVGRASPHDIVEEILRVVTEHRSASEYKYKYSMRTIAIAMKTTRTISKAPQFAEIRAFAENADRNFTGTHRPRIFSEEPEVIVAK